MRKAIIIILCLQACAVSKTVYTENIFNSWLWHTGQELMLQLGAPTQIVADGSGGQIYVYDHSYAMTVGYSSPGQFYSTPSGLAVPGYQPTRLNYQPGNTVSNQFTVQKKVEYFINTAGYIYAWRSVGYPKTYQQRYTKSELQGGTVDTTLFIPPKAPR